MKLTAVALVLIVGAAVVLWFGNMLNSWVLGGLIGGLAALLLSIPISLTLFSYFSRRHDERLRAEAQEEILAQMYAEDVADPYQDDPYHLEAEQRWQEAISPPRRTASQQIATPNYLPLPPAGQSHAHTLESLPARRRSMNLAPLSRQVPSARAKELPVRQPTRGMYYPNEQATSLRTQALRAAQREATQQYREAENLPVSTSRHAPMVRPSQSLVEQTGRLSRQVPQRPANPATSRRTVNALYPQGNTPRRSTPLQGTGPQQTTQGLPSRMNDPRTEQLRGRQITGPVRQTQTGQIARNPQLGGALRNPDVITGTLKNPLVRRAPYTYEDDPIRQEFARQIDAPIARRSSRYEQQDYEEEE